MTMLEKVARAIEPDWFTEDGSPPVICNYPGHHLKIQERAMKQAIAAVKALRQPTEEIIALGGNGPWQAFIDSILATQPQEQER